MAKRIMRSFRLDEISTVDRPAQTGARMTIMKRDDTNPAVEAITKRWIDPAEGAKSFSEILQVHLDEDRYCNVMREVGPQINALETSLRSIAGDRNIEADAKQTAMRESVEAFMTAMREKSPDIEDAIAKVFTDPEGSYAGEPAGDTIGKKEFSMTDAPKTVADLEKQVAGLKLNDDVKKAVDSIVTFAKQVEADKADAETVAKMSDDEKAHMDGLESDKDKAAFKALSAEQRAEAVGKAKDADAVIFKAEDGTEYRKSDDARLVAMAKQRDADAKELRKERTERQMSDLRKRADDEFAHVPGSTDERAAMLKAVDAIEDEDVRKAFNAVFTQAEKLAKAGFDTVGHGNGQVAEGSAEDKLNKKADEYAKANSVSFSKAYDAVLGTDEGKRLYEESLRA